MLSPGRYILPLLLFFLCKQTPSHSQQAATDTAFLAASKKKSISLYTASIQRQSRLYNGTDYIVYLPKYEEHPYFQLDDWTYGSIIYWGELYENVPLLYDLSIDQVVTEHNRGNPIKLIAEKIDGFTMLDHTFVRLERDSNNNISAGFYDRLYDGTSKVYAKHQKAHRETLEAKEVIPRFDESTRYFLYKDGLLHPVKTKGSVIQILEDHKQEVKTYIRKNRIYFKNNRDVAIVRVTEFYDSLID
jgi:hypothetical protein